MSKRKHTRNKDNENNKDYRISKKPKLHIVALHNTNNSISDSISNSEDYQKIHNYLLVNQPKKDENTYDLSQASDIWIRVLIYLSIKHDNVCTIPEFYFRIKNKKELIDIYYRNYFIKYEIDTRKLIVNNFFLTNYIGNCNGKDIVILPLRIYNNKGTIDHLNVLVCNIKNKQIERFEPLGSNAFENLFSKDNPETNIDYQLEQLFIQLLKGDKYSVSYYSPVTFCPLYNFQSIESKDTQLLKQIHTKEQLLKTLNSEDKDTDSKQLKHSKKLLERLYGNNLPTGFCATWTLFYLDLRLQFPDIERDKIIEHAISVLNKQNKSYRFIIYKYALWYSKIKDEVQKCMDKHSVTEELRKCVENISL